MSIVCDRILEDCEFAMCRGLNPFRIERTTAKIKNDVINVDYIIGKTDGIIYGTALENTGERELEKIYQGAVERASKIDWC